MRPDPLAVVGTALMLAGFGGALAVFLATRRPRRYAAPHHRFRDWYGDRFRGAGTDGYSLRNSDGTVTGRWGQERT